MNQGQKRKTFLFKCGALFHYLFALRNTHYLFYSKQSKSSELYIFVSYNFEHKKANKILIYLKHTILKNTKMAKKDAANKKKDKTTKGKPRGKPLKPFKKKKKKGAKKRSRAMYAYTYVGKGKNQVKTKLVFPNLQTRMQQSLLSTEKKKKSQMDKWTLQEQQLEDDRYEEPLTQDQQFQKTAALVNRLIVQNKVSAKNAFQVPILQINKLIQLATGRTNDHIWKKVSSALENGYKVYGYRVDATHNYVFNVLSTIYRHSQPQQIEDEQNFEQPDEQIQKRLDFRSTINNESFNMYLENINNLKSINMDGFETMNHINPFFEKIKKKFDHHANLKYMLMNTTPLQKDKRLQVIPEIYQFVDLRQKQRQKRIQREKNSKQAFLTQRKNLEERINKQLGFSKNQIMKQPQIHLPQPDPKFNNDFKFPHLCDLTIDLKKQLKQPLPNQIMNNKMEYLWMRFLYKDIQYLGLQDMKQPEDYETYVKQELKKQKKQQQNIKRQRQHSMVDIDKDQIQEIKKIVKISDVVQQTSQLILSSQAKAISQKLYQNQQKHIVKQQQSKYIVKKQIIQRQQHKKDIQKKVDAQKLQNLNEKQIIKNEKIVNKKVQSKTHQIMADLELNDNQKGITGQKNPTIQKNKNKNKQPQSFVIIPGKKTKGTGTMMHFLKIEQPLKKQQFIEENEENRIAQMDRIGQQLFGIKPKQKSKTKKVKIQQDASTNFSRKNKLQKQYTSSTFSAKQVEKIQKRDVLKTKGGLKKQNESESQIQIPDYSISIKERYLEKRFPLLPRYDLNKLTTLNFYEQQKPTVAEQETQHNNQNYIPCYKDGDNISYLSHQLGTNLTQNQTLNITNISQPLDSINNVKKDSHGMKQYKDRIMAYIDIEKGTKFENIFVKYLQYDGYLSPALCFLTMLHICNQKNLIMKVDAEIEDDFLITQYQELQVPAQPETQQQNARAKENAPKPSKMVEYYSQFEGLQIQDVPQQGKLQKKQMKQEDNTGNQKKYTGQENSLLSGVKVQQAKFVAVNSTEKIIPIQKQQQQRVSGFKPPRYMRNQDQQQQQFKMNLK